MQSSSSSSLMWIVDELFDVRGWGAVTVLTIGTGTYMKRYQPDVHVHKYAYELVHGRLHEPVQENFHKHVREHVH